MVGLGQHLASSRHWVGSRLTHGLVGIAKTDLGELYRSVVTNRELSKTIFNFQIDLCSDPRLWS